MSNPPTPAPGTDSGAAHRFGEVALSMGLLKPEQLQAGLRRQEELRRSGAKTRIGEALILAKALDTEQVKRVLSEQRKRRQTDANAKLPTERFGEFLLLERLGEGGMGTVFKARDVLGERIVALKVLRKGLGVEKEFTSRFERESKSAGKLDHPHIVGTHSFGILRGIQYLAMEYVEGETLRARLERDGAQPEAEALRIALGVAKGLGHAHEAGLVHRDVKPENVLLGKEGAVKLADLGLAKSVHGEAHLTKTGQIIGTPYYISPEQARGDKGVDPRSDFYALGGTLYHALTGRVPFEAPSALDIMLLHIQGALTNPKDLKPDLSEGAVQVVVKLMAKAPEDRYPSAAPLVEDLERLLRGQAPAHAGLDLNRSSILPPDPNRAKALMARGTAKQTKGCLSRASIFAMLVGLAIYLW